MLYRIYVYQKIYQKRGDIYIMPKGNKLAYLNSPMCDNSDVDKEENALLINHCLDIFHLKEPDLSSTEEVTSAIDYYFNSCLSKGLRPGNMGLYAALGLNKNEVKDMLSGRQKSFNGRRVNNDVIPLIKKACKALSLYRELLGSQGKLNPATLIFWQKNFDGLEDVQRVDVAPINALQPERTPEELAQIIENDIPTDE